MADHRERDGSWVTLSLQHVPTATRLARASMRSVLVALGLRREFIADAEIVMNELVGNAVEHGAGDTDGMIEAAWRLTPEELEIRVRDSGRARALEAGTLDFSEDPHVRGRGLAIVAALSRRWSHETIDGRTQVTAAITLPQQ